MRGVASLGGFLGLGVRGLGARVWAKGYFQALGVRVWARVGVMEFRVQASCLYRG